MKQGLRRERMSFWRSLTPWSSLKRCRSAKSWHNITTARRCPIVVGVAGLLAWGHAAAHHSFAAAYDENAPLNMQGVVTKVELTNPHSWLWVDITDEDGTVTNWGFEGGPPVNLFRNGLTRDTLPVGSEIKVFAYRAKSGENKGVAVFFEYLDGSKVFMGGSAPGADGQPRPERAR